MSWYCSALGLVTNGLAFLGSSSWALSKELSKKDDDEYGFSTVALTTIAGITFLNSLFCTIDLGVKFYKRKGTIYSLDTQSVEEKAITQIANFVKSALRDSKFSKFSSQELPEDTPIFIDDLIDVLNGLLFQLESQQKTAKEREERLKKIDRIRGDLVKHKFPHKTLMEIDPYQPEAIGEKLIARLKTTRLSCK